MNAKPKAAPKAGQKKPVVKPVAAAAGSSNKASPGTSMPGTPARGDIPSFEDALNAAPESFSASNLVRAVPEALASPKLLYSY